MTKFVNMFLNFLYLLSFSILGDAINIYIFIKYMQYFYTYSLFLLLIEHNSPGVTQGLRGVFLELIFITLENLSIPSI